MGLKCYFHVKSFTGQLDNIPALNAAIEQFMDIDTTRPGYHGFVQVRGNGIKFWMGEAGEDSDDIYFPGCYRTFGEEVDMCQALANHLTSGMISVYVENEGNEPKFYEVTPGHVIEFNPFNGHRGAPGTSPASQAMSQQANAMLQQTAQILGSFGVSSLTIGNQTISVSSAQQPGSAPQAPMEEQDS